MSRARPVSLGHDGAGQGSAPEPNAPASAFDFITPDGQVVAFAAAQAALKARVAVLIGGFLVGYGLPTSH